MPKHKRPSYKAHKVSKEFNEDASLQKFKNIWYMKKEGDPQRANREIVAQEFFRLIIASQPKTRLATTGTRDGTYILSKEVEGYQPLATMDKADFQQGITSGRYHGFGQVLVCSMVMKEKDLSVYNLGKDKNNNIIKIDGGGCLTELSASAKSSSFTSTDIDRLPYPNDYATNWLDLVNQGINSPVSEFVTPDLATNKLFREDVNIGIMRILSIPSELIKTFVTSIVNNRMEAMKITEEILAQIAQLEMAALNNTHFKSFMQTPVAQTSFEEHVKHLQSFKLPTKEFMLPMETIDESKLDEITEEETEDEVELESSNKTDKFFAISEEEEDEEEEDVFEKALAVKDKKIDISQPQEDSMRANFKQLQEKSSISKSEKVSNTASQSVLTGSMIAANLRGLYKSSNTKPSMLKSLETIREDIVDKTISFHNTTPRI
jgi:hypothetical protein